ncbi:MAG: type IV toxin-antitoxin system AbiEi family antitoxin [Deltaproteobacteria bacterium]|jgi:hypothetical protein
MEAKDKEREILQKALEGLQKTAKLNVQIQYGNYDFDAILRIGLHEMEWEFAAEVKKAVTPATLGAFVRQLRIFPQEQKGLLVTWYVTPQMADRMKEMDIQFIDVAGNAYINDPPLFVFIKGNRPVDRYPTERPPRALQPTGLQVIFALLCNPGLENEPFRQIAKVANAALGTVGWVIRDLKRMGHLLDRGKRGRHLLRKKELLERWVTIYPDQLRPKNLVGRYRAPNPEWWKREELTNFTAYWGGEIAAAKLTKYLRPQIITIYVKGKAGKLLLKHKIMKEANGNIEILNAFWNFEYEWQFPKLVHPILIYADLLATGDTRNIETAEIIYERELTRFIREN